MATIYERNAICLSEKTSKKVAQQASKVLRNIGTRKDAKASAASALSQRAPKKLSRSSRKSKRSSFELGDEFYRPLQNTKNVIRRPYEFTGVCERRFNTTSPFL